MCVRPMNVKDNIVPCGKCFECKNLDRVSWSIRVQHEIKDGLMVTLTYDDNHLPKDGKLNKKHLIDYLKRVREALRKNGHTDYKYFAVGEYGERYGRPHYHIITNNRDINTHQIKWKNGNVHIGEVTGASIHYCTKYVTKSSGWKKDQDKERREWRIMSKSLGISYVKQWREYHRKNEQTFIVHNSVKYPLPRYYRDKIFSSDTGLTYTKPVIRHKVDKTTGEIIEYKTTQTTKIKERDIDLREQQEKNKLKKLKKLMEMYGDMLRTEVDDRHRKYFEKYRQMYEHLKEKNL